MSPCTPEVRVTVNGECESGNLNPSAPATSQWGAPTHFSPPAESAFQNLRSTMQCHRMGRLAQLQRHYGRRGWLANLRVRPAQRTRSYRSESQRGRCPGQRPIGAARCRIAFIYASRITGNDLGCIMQKQRSMQQRPPQHRPRVQRSSDPFQ